VLAGMKSLKLQRRLASCRLHRCVYRLLRQLDLLCLVICHFISVGMMLYEG
jgi:hypothetical protein